MTEENTSTESKEEPTTTTTTPPVQKEAPAAAPAIDVDDIVRQATEKLSERTNQTVSEAVKKNIQGVFKQLAGEPEDNKPNPLLQAMVKNPEDFFTTIAGEIEKRVDNKTKQNTATVNTINKVSAKYIRDYPELQEFEDVVNAEFSKTTDSTPLDERLDTAFKQAAKRLKLVPLHERDRDEQLKYQGIPGIGGGNKSYATAASIKEKSEVDFIRGRKDAFAKARSKQHKQAS